MSTDPVEWEPYANLFAAQEAGSALEGVRSRCAVLDLAAAPEELRAAVLDRVKLPGRPTTMALTRFAPGDYMLPQRPAEAFGEADWYVYRAFGGSDVDGLTFWDGSDFVRVLDAEEREVALDPRAWCWTSPVRGSVRHAVLIGGRDA